VPPLLRVVRGPDRERLFMLAIVAIALGVALATHAAGCRSGLGLPGGIVVSETEFRRASAGRHHPIRDIFATLFFVAVGMLIDPYALIAQWQLVLGFALVLVIGSC
jgi:CPA2 family monovalent cation:H+ antiporter-2